MRRRIVSFFVAWCLVFSHLAPVHAFAPAVPVIYVGAAAYTWSVGQIASLVVAGAAITSILVSDSGSSGESTRIHVNPKSPQTVPAGWTASGTAGNAPTPPAVANSIVTYQSFNANPATYYSTKQAAANASCTAGNRGTGVLITGNVYDCTTTFGSVGTPCDASHTGNCVQFNTQTTCATGYTLSSGTCNLTNAAVVVKPADSVAEKKIASGTIVDVTNDPDTGVAQPTSATSTKIIYKNGTSTTSIAVETDGSITVSKTTGNGNGTSTRETMKLSPPDSGAANGGTVATGVKTEQVIGEGSTSDTDTATGSVTCTNCGLETTQQQVKTAVQDIVTNGVKVQEQVGTWTTSPSSVATSQAATDTQVAALKSKGDTAASSGNAADLGSGLTNLSVPTVKHTSTSFWDSYFPAPATCSAVAISSSGRWSGLSLDVCPVLNSLRVVVEWGLYLLTALVVYQSWFGRRDTGVA